RFGEGQKPLSLQEGPWRPRQSRENRQVRRKSERGEQGANETAPTDTRCTVGSRARHAAGFAKEKKARRPLPHSKSRQHEFGSCRQRVPADPRCHSGFKIS